MIATSFPDKERSKDFLFDSFDSFLFIKTNNYIRAEIEIENRKQGLSKKRHCIECDREFRPGNSKTIKCNKCFIVLTCDTCGFHFINKRLINSKAQENDFKSFCSHICQASYQAKINAKINGFDGLLKWQKENVEEANKIRYKNLKDWQENNPEKVRELNVRNIKEVHKSLYKDTKSTMNHLRKSMLSEDSIKRRIIAQNNILKSMSKELMSERLKKSLFSEESIRKNALTRSIRFKNDPEYRRQVLSNLKAFDREEFYSDKFSCISFESLEREVEINDIDKYRGIGVVFSKEIHHPDGSVICLDVAESKDGLSELLFGIRALAWAKENINLTKEEMELKNLSVLGTRLKYQSMIRKAEDMKIIFKIVASGVSEKEEREAIEAQYAHDTKALFWSPAPGQKLSAPIKEETHVL